LIELKLQFPTVSIPFHPCPFESTCSGLLGMPLYFAVLLLTKPFWVWSINQPSQPPWCDPFLSNSLLPLPHIRRSKPISPVSKTSKEVNSARFPCFHLKLTAPIRQTTGNATRDHLRPPWKGISIMIIGVARSNECVCNDLSDMMLGIGLVRVIVLWLAMQDR